MRNVAVLMPPTVRPFELAVYCEVFGVDRTDRGVPPFDFAICSERPGVPVRTSGGMHVTATHDLSRLAAADLVAVAPPAAPILETDPSVGVEEAAVRAGFSSAAPLRQHFQRRFGCSPTEYRARFAPSSPG